MEKHPHQEYRDDLAEKLKDIRNSDLENPEVAKAKAEGYLEAKQESKEYAKAKEYITEEREEQFRERLNEAKLLEIESELSEQADKLTAGIVESISLKGEIEEPNFSSDLREVVYSMLKLTRFVDLKKCNPELKDIYYGKELKDVLTLTGNFSGLKEVSENPEFQNISRQILLQTLDRPYYSENTTRGYTDINITETKNVQDRFSIPSSYVESSEFQDILEKQLLSIVDNEGEWFSNGIRVLESIVATNLTLSERILQNPKFIDFVKKVFIDSRIGFNLSKMRNVIETHFHFSESDIKDLGASLIKESLNYYPFTSRGPAHTPQRAVELYSEAIESANAKALLFNISEDEMKGLVRNRIKRMEERLKEGNFLAGSSEQSYSAVKALLERTYSI